MRTEYQVRGKWDLPWRSPQSRVWEWFFRVGHIDESTIISFVFTTPPPLVHTDLLISLPVFLVNYIIPWWIPLLGQRSWFLYGISVVLCHSETSVSPYSNSGLRWIMDTGTRSVKWRWRRIKGFQSYSQITLLSILTRNLRPFTIHLFLFQVEYEKDVLFSSYLKITTLSNSIHDETKKTKRR